MEVRNLANICIFNKGKEAKQIRRCGEVDTRDGPKLR